MFWSHWDKLLQVRMSAYDLFTRTSLRLFQGPELHYVWELGHSWAVPVVVALQLLAAGPPIAAYHLVLPHSPYSCQSHAARQGESPHSLIAGIAETQCNVELKFDWTINWFDKTHAQLCWQSLYFLFLKKWSKKSQVPTSPNGKICCFLFSYVRNEIYLGFRLLVKYNKTFNYVTLHKSNCLK